MTLMWFPGGISEKKNHSVNQKLECFKFFPSALFYFKSWSENKTTQINKETNFFFFILKRTYLFSAKSIGLVICTKILKIGFQHLFFQANELYHNKLALWSQSPWGLGSDGRPDIIEVWEMAPVISLGPTVARSQALLSSVLGMQHSRLALLLIFFIPVFFVFSLWKSYCCSYMLNLLNLSSKLLIYLCILFLYFICWEISSVLPFKSSIEFFISAFKFCVSQDLFSLEKFKNMSLFLVWCLQYFFCLCRHSSGYWVGLMYGVVGEVSAFCMHLFP